MKQGWEIKKLGEIAEIVGGSTPKTNEPTYWGGEHYWVTPAVLDGAKYISSTPKSITDAGVKSAHLQLLPIGTVLLSSRAPIGKVAITTVPMYCNQGFKNLVCSDKLYNEFAYWFLYHNTEYLNSLGTGATFKEISKRVVEQIPIPIPSLEEQERIVEILDREFERIDALKANAEKSLQHAKDLLKQSQNTVFNSIETFPLDSMVTIINGYAFKSEDFSKTNPVKAVKITNVGVGVFIETIDTNLPQSLLLDKQDYTVHTGDIVFALTRTIIAAGLKVAIVPESYNCALLNQRVAALRIDDDIQRKYLYNYFQTASVKEYVLKKVNTLMQPNLSIKDLKAMPIPYCNRAEMEQVVARLDKLKENSQALEDNYKKTIALCDDMKQALLRKAFNGEL